jgi:uncharacterized protein (DUF2126 family)
MVSGESLPRWGYSLYWRRDGVPIWRDLALIAAKPLPGKRLGSIDVGAARDFLVATAVKLGVSADYGMPVYEDAVDWIVREAELPDNTDPLDPKIEDAEVRNRFMRTFQRGLTKPIGHALPIQRWQSQNHAPRWMSEHWRVRRGVLYAVPGIRRWAIACRWARCPMSRRPTIPISTRRTAPRSAIPCPISAPA